MKVKIKPPAEPKILLMQQVQIELYKRYKEKNPPQVEYLLNFFTSADLVGIRDELRKGN